MQPSASASASATDPAALAPSPAGGLSGAEAARRLREGQGNTVQTTTGRSVGEILRANVLTRFNALLGGLLAVILIVGPLQDALFGLLLVANSGIGIVQELRARSTLQRLAVLTAPHARVIRDAEVASCRVDQVVLGDLLVLDAGDQVVVDGEMVRAEGLEVNEALLTGESEPVPKAVGDRVLSGSFAAIGHGWYRATRVGQDAYAASLAAQARRFALVRSELREVTNEVLRLVTWVLVPTAVLLAATQFTLGGHQGWQDAVRGSVAGVVGMVPEGFVLLTSMAFALGVIRLARRRVLVQELPAIEALARVDVVCLDKTGTLTEAAMRVADVDVLADALPVPAALGALAAADPRPNATLAALGARFDDPGWQATGSTAFSAARKWSSTSFAGQGTWILGAPEMVLPAGHAQLATATRRAESGQRVLLLAHADAPPADGVLPGSLRPVALVALQERLRPTAAATLEYFAREGVTVKLISGDAPATVAAVARRLNLPGADEPCDARELSGDPDALADAMEHRHVFGRVNPQQKQQMVDALQRNGHTVAMTGDGVNDVLALKQADIGVAIGAGASAARAVARLVLLDSSFDALPAVVVEGRRIIGNIERVAGLFLTKTVYVMLLAVAVGVTRLPFPFFPRHLTVISTLTIGVPGFFLALSREAERARTGILPRVLRFAVPAGAVTAAAAYIAYAIARAESDADAADARTTATLVTTALGLWVLARLARPLRPLRVALVASMAAAFVGVLAVPPLRDALALRALSLEVWLSATTLAVAAGLLMEVLLRIAAHLPPREVSSQPEPEPAPRREPEPEPVQLPQPGPPARPLSPDRPQPPPSDS
ncbi:HAD-IC family P-type ATPase [Actinocrinis puniceicyclus]|uniref:HAD-IC family P-type ATPase n=1 Tax=Actinocrinis puniceicyclus TaxID=977794 RepID=UPI0028AB49CE|nr:HAD-IC family P-type ATPase [Actinocrinis puniceicyclus]